MAAVQGGRSLDPMMALFPVSPMQPKGIMVSWDDGTESLMYVTNLEPEGSEGKGSSPQEGVSQEGGARCGCPGGRLPERQ